MAEEEPEVVAADPEPLDSPELEDPLVDEEESLEPLAEVPFAEESVAEDSFDEESLEAPADVVVLDPRASLR